MQAIARREMAQAHLALVGVTLLAALAAAAVPAFTGTLRAWFAFDPEARPSAGGVAGIAAANLRVLGVVLLAALAARQRELVPLLDVVVALGTSSGCRGSTRPPFVSCCPSNLVSRSVRPQLEAARGRGRSGARKAAARRSYARVTRSG